jgi:hypothetical protein
MQDFVSTFKETVRINEEARKEFQRQAAERMVHAADSLLEVFMLTVLQHLESRRRRPARRASVAGGAEAASRAGSRYLAAVPETIEIVDVDVQARRARPMFGCRGLTMCPPGISSAFQACCVQSFHKSRQLCCGVAATARVAGLVFATTPAYHAAVGMGNFTSHRGICREQKGAFRAMWPPSASHRVFRR